MQELKEQLKKVIEYYQKVSTDIDIDILYDKWRCNKDKLIKLLNLNTDTYINESEEDVTIELSEEEKKENQYNYLLKYNIPDLNDYIDLYQNKFIKDFEDTKIGTRFIKMLPYLLESRTKATIERSINEASRMIQQVKITGKLCISVNPLDYLSISENICNWRSCHSLDGEYSTGNLQYMVDSSTVVCYIKEEKDYVLPRFPEDVPWNSKKWRVLLYFSNDKTMIFTGRQYPFSSNKILTYVKSLFPFVCTDWENYNFNQSIKFNIIDDYFPIGMEIKAKKDLIKQPFYPLLYNDLLYSTYYKPFYMYIGTIYPDNAGLTKSSTKFYIGEDVLCLHCGSHYIKDNGSIYCPECEEKYGKLVNDNYCFCKKCGRHMIYNEEKICEDCMEEEYYGD